MQIGMIDLGRMGSNMVKRLMKFKHQCIVYDVEAKNVDAQVKEGDLGAKSLDKLVDKLSKPRADGDFADKVLSAMWSQFGRHKEKSVSDKGEES